MALPTYDVIGTRPRTFAKASDLAVKKASTNASLKPIAGSFWNNKLKPYVSRNLDDFSNDPASIVDNADDFHLKLLTFLLVYWVEEGQTDLALSAARSAKDVLAYAVNYDASDKSSGKNRSFNMALGLGFDFLYDSLSSGEKADIIDKIISNGAILGSSSDDLIDGHSGGDMAAQFVGTLAVHGEGTSAQQSAVDALLIEALKFWFCLDGVNKGRIGYNQYFMADGGGGKGTHYEQAAMEMAVWFIEAFSNGLGNVQMNLEDYDILTAETWIQKVGEWFLRTSLRGDYDYHNIGDTIRVSKPFFAAKERNTYAFLCAHGGPWRKNMRWLYDLKNAKSEALGHQSTYGQALSWLLFDWDDPDNAYEPPSQSGVSKSRLFVRPGSYWYHNTWDVAAIDGKTPGINNCIINIHCPTFFYYGHIAQDVGSIRINVRDDQVVMKRGVYDTSTIRAGSGGDHTVNWNHATISSSGVVLVDDDPLLTSGKGGTPNPAIGRPHTARVDRGSGGDTEAISHAQGGQLYKKDSITNAVDPVDVDTMSMAGGTGAADEGLTWRRVNGFNTPNSGGMELVHSDDDYDYLTADLRRAYLRQEEDTGEDEERASLYKAQWMIIKKDFDLPVIFMHHRVRSRDPLMTRAQIWNHWGQAVVPGGVRTAPVPGLPEGPGRGGIRADIRNYMPRHEHLNACLFEASGLVSAGDEALEDALIGRGDPATQGGRVTIAYYCPERDISAGLGVHIRDSGSNWTQAGSLENAHAYNVDGLLETHPPGVDLVDPISFNFRDIHDVGKFRTEIEILQGDPKPDETSFVCLVIPRVAERAGGVGLTKYEIPGSTSETFRFSEKDGFFVLTINGREGQRVFKLHKTTDDHKGPSEISDVTPPEAPLSLSASVGPGAGQLTLNWNVSPEDQGVVNYKLYQRVKV